MGFLDSLFGGGGGGGGISATSNPFSSLGNGLSGTSSDAGILGMGQFKAKGYNIDPNAFATPGIDTRQASFEGALAQAQARQAPQANVQAVGSANLGTAAQVGAASQFGGATIDQSPQLQFRQRELDLANQLQGQANGQGPSVAQSQLQTATDRNLKQAMALQASSRGNNAGAGLRQAAQQQSEIGSEAARASADLRANEQMAARSQLAGVLGQGRGADIGLATNQAGLGQQAGLANQAALNNFALTQAGMNQQTGLANQAAINDNNRLQAQFGQQTALANMAALQQQGSENDGMARFYQGGLSAMDIQKIQSQQELQKLGVQQATGLANANAVGYAGASKARGGALSGIGQMFGGLGGMFGGGGGGGGSGGGSGGYPGGDNGGTEPDNYVSQDSQNPEGGYGTPVGEQQPGPDSSVNYSPMQPKTMDDPSGGGYLTGNNNNFARNNNASRFSFMNYYNR